MVTSPDYRHVPTGTLAVLAQRLGMVWASPSTWHLWFAKTQSRPFYRLSEMGQSASMLKQ